MTAFAVMTRSDTVETIDDSFSVPPPPPQGALKGGGGGKPKESSELLDGISRCNSVGHLREGTIAAADPGGFLGDDGLRG